MLIHLHRKELICRLHLATSNSRTVIYLMTLKWAEFSSYILKRLTFRVKNTQFWCTYYKKLYILNLTLKTKWSCQTQWFSKIIFSRLLVSFLILSGNIYSSILIAQIIFSVIITLLCTVLSSFYKWKTKVGGDLEYKQ